MAQLERNQRIAYNDTGKVLAGHQKDLAKIYKSALRIIRADLLEFAEKTDMSLDGANKYDRLKKLNKKLGEELKHINEESYKELVKEEKIVGSNSYNRTGYGYDTETGFLNGIKGLRADQLNAIIKQPYPEVNLVDFYKKLGAESFNRLKIVLGQGLLRSDSVTKVSKAIRDALEIDFNRALRIARTEMLRVHTKTQLLADERANELGIDTDKIWLHKGSSRPGYEPREQHISMNGKEADDKGMFHLPSGASGTAPRLTGNARDDINCTCTYVSKIVGIDDDYDKKAVKDYKDKLKDMSYEEWLKFRG